MNVLNRMEFNLRTFLSLIIVFIYAGGCASADVMLLDPSRAYNPTANVQLIFEEPESEYEVIAIIEAKASQYNTESDAFKAARKEARKIGAHAIIPMTTEKKEVQSETIPNPVAGSPPIYIAGGTQLTMKFAAIRFIR